MRHFIHVDPAQTPPIGSVQWTNCLPSTRMFSVRLLAPIESTRFLSSVLSPTTPSVHCKKLCHISAPLRAVCI